MDRQSRFHRYPLTPYVQASPRPSVQGDDDALRQSGEAALQVHRKLECPARFKINEAMERGPKESCGIHSVVPEEPVALEDVENDVRD